METNLEITDPDVRLPMEAMIRLIEEERDRQCRRILEDAVQQARIRIRATYAKARAQVHAAIEEERARAQREFAGAHARLESAGRAEYQDVLARNVHRGWQVLNDALHRRWHAADSRQQWLTALVTQALDVLPRGRWEIVHPADWALTELDTWQDRIQAHCDAAPQFAIDEAIAGGLRLCAGDVCLDGTVTGLLADRRYIEARLLALAEPALES